MIPSPLCGGGLGWGETHQEKRKRSPANPSNEGEATCHENIRRYRRSPVVPETPYTPPWRFAFGENFLIPAATDSFRLSGDTGGHVKIVKAFFKPAARSVPD